MELNEPAGSQTMLGLPIPWYFSDMIINGGFKMNNVKTCLTFGLFQQYKKIDMSCFEMVVMTCAVPQIRIKDDYIVLYYGHPGLSSSKFFHLPDLQKN